LLEAPNHLDSGGVRRVELDRVSVRGQCMVAVVELRVAVREPLDDAARGRNVSAFNRNNSSASRGYRMLVKNRRELWGQTVSRFLSPDGLLIGITYTPAFRDKK
jgi:hypothetical protein